MMNDGHRDNSVGERKLIWDEENRLLSVDDNGFVSNYWYDADGERTVKTSGESDQVYVNGVSFPFTPNCWRVFQRSRTASGSSQTLC